MFSSSLLLAILIISTTSLLLLIAKYVYRKNDKIKYNYFKKDDSSAQSDYSSHFSKNQRLSLDELVELSWKFLYSITEAVANKFSPADQEEVSKIGQELSKLGMRYEHVINNTSDPRTSQLQKRAIVSQDGSAIARK